MTCAGGASVTDGPPSHVVCTCGRGAPAHFQRVTGMCLPPAAFVLQVAVVDPEALARTFPEDVRSPGWTSSWNLLLV